MVLVDLQQRGDLTGTKRSTFMRNPVRKYTIEQMAVTGHKDLFVENLDTDRIVITAHGLRVLKKARE